MTKAEFETILSSLVERLTKELRESDKYHKSAVFEDRVRAVLAERPALGIDLSPKAQEFPDIVIGDFGIEVKYSDKDTWRSIANSVFEGSKNANVKYVYVVFGKIGGTPAAKWGRYEDCVIHVRTSHVPRFELEMDSSESLFQKFGLTYDIFSSLPPEQKMQHIREYARGRLKEGERLWWLDDSTEPEHTLPLNVRLYTSLSTEEKRQFRAEATLLCPQIVGPSRMKNKYNDVAMYLLTVHGVLATQVRDLFSAGSVAMRSDARRGGNYILRALKDLEPEMRDAASSISTEIFKEYWGIAVPPKLRIAKWLEMADKHAVGWRPSAKLFTRK